VVPAKGSLAADEVAKPLTVKAVDELGIALGLGVAKTADQRFVAFNPRRDLDRWCGSRGHYIRQQTGDHLELVDNLKNGLDLIGRQFRASGLAVAIATPGIGGRLQLRPLAEGAKNNLSVLGIVVLVELSNLIAFKPLY